MRLLLITILLSCLCKNSLGQNSLYQQQYWIRYQNQLAFNERISWNNEIDNRRFISPDQQTQLIVHSRLHFKKDRWDFAGGVTASWAYTPIPEIKVAHPTFEIRPVVEASYEIRFKKLLLHQRIRIDNRFFERDNLDDVFGAYEYVARFRYRIQARTALRKDQEGRQLVGFKVADEIMLNHKGNFFDQHRVYASFDFKLSSRFNLEAGYINIYQRARNKDLFYHRDVLRLSLLHIVNL
jgi:hypothetical protein